MRAGISSAWITPGDPGREGPSGRGSEGSGARRRVQYQEGLITDGRRYNKIVDIWAGVAVLGRRR
jgi:hypothetical protein